MITQTATTESAGEPTEEAEEVTELAAPQILFTVTRVQDMSGTNGQTVAERVELTPAGTSSAHEAHLDPGHQQATSFSFTVSNPKYLHFFEPGKFVVAHFERLEAEEAQAIANPPSEGTAAA